MRLIRQLHLFGALGALTLATACAEPGAPDDGLVPVRVTLQRAGGAATAETVNGLLASVVSAQGVVDPGNIEAFTAQLDAVEVHTQGSGWVDADITPGPIDLLDLPTAGDPAILLGMVDVEPGKCKVRLFISSLTIRLFDDVTVGQQTFPGGTDITTDIKVPSGGQTGLKARGVCELDGGTDLTLVFDEGSTLGKIVATGNGTIIVTPVIHVETS